MPKASAYQTEVRLYWSDYFGSILLFFALFILNW